jgi:NADPH:quinone reductase-like Zn-dependent oxidoreductase
MIGVLSGSSLATPLGLIITRQVRLQGVTVGHRDGFEAMLRAIEQHRPPVVVDRVFEFAALHGRAGVSEERRAVRQDLHPPLSGKANRRSTARSC